MRCTRCHKTVTEQTARIYQGRCVSCDRMLVGKRLWRMIGDCWGFLGFLVCFPFQIIGGLPRLVRPWCTRYPFTRREVTDAIAAVHGEEAARMYFWGLREGFLQPGSWMSGRHPFYSLGLNDGSAIRNDPSQWRALLQRRASKRPY